MEKITIVVPVYNTEKYLGECLESLLCQTYSDLSIICVNDGSKDNSLQVIKEYADKDKRISYLSIENSGAATARNKGIDEFLKRNDSEFITFVDSDDTVQNNFIDNLFSSLKRFDADAACCDLYYGKGDRGNGEFICYSQDEITYEYFKDLKFNESPCCKLLKKELINKVRFNDGKHFEDTFICYKWLNRIKKCAYVNYAGYNVRQRENSTTRVEYSDYNYHKVEAGLEIYNNYKGSKFEDIAYNKYLGILYYFIIKTNGIKDKVSMNAQAIEDARNIVKENGFKKQRFVFYPFTIATKFGLIGVIKI